MGNVRVTYRGDEPEKRPKVRVRVADPEPVDPNEPPDGTVIRFRTGYYRYAALRVGSDWYTTAVGDPDDELVAEVVEGRPGWKPIAAVERWSRIRDWGEGIEIAAAWSPFTRGD